MSKTTQQHSGKQLLIVEDDEVFSAMLSKALTKKGFNVSCTNSIATATQAAKSNPPNDSLQIPVKVPLSPTEKKYYP